MVLNRDQLHLYAPVKRVKRKLKPAAAKNAALLILLAFMDAPLGRFTLAELRRRTV